MFNINKIQGHIKKLRLRELKLERYLEEERQSVKPNDLRIVDINRALEKVNNSIEMWEGKLTAFKNAPPRPPEKKSVLDGDPYRPLIG